MEEFFTRHFTVSVLSDSQALITSTLNGRTRRTTVTVGESFGGVVDKHGSTRYRLVAVTPASVEIRYTLKFDARSFGGRVGQCAGIITLKR